MSAIYIRLRYDKYPSNKAEYLRNWKYSTIANTLIVVDYIL